MPRKSVKENKTRYQLAREDAGLTREQAGELMEFVTESRIEKIESEKMQPSPEDVLAMSKAYKRPELCNYYCSRECPIGQENVPEITPKELSQIVLEMLSSLNTLTKERDRLIDISVDGKISDDELEDFARIRKELAQISLTVDTLQLWVNNTIAQGGIDKEKLDALSKNI